MDRMNFLKSITEACGIPGFEREVREVIANYLPTEIQVSRDNLGSMICRKTGDADGPKIMVPGHMDEIGFMVNLITEEGYIKFIPLGGWWDQVMLAQQVKIRTSKGYVTGVIGSKPPHILKEEERNKVVKKADMFIDVGAANKQQAETEFGIQPGDPIFPVCDFQQMHNPKVLMAKAWDDRVGCAAFVELLRELGTHNHPNTVYGVGTVQEEVGLRGAQTSAQTIRPDICIAIDVGIAGDMPGVKPEESPLKLGEGPVMYLADNSVIAHYGLRKLVMEKAKETNIPLQFATLLGGGTDAGAVHLVGSGVPSLTLGVPVRYLHSHSGLLHLDDYINLIKLLVEVIKVLDWETVKGLHR